MSVYITAVSTRLSEHPYTFEWTVHNFSKTPGRIETPAFSVAPGYPSEWFFSISCVSEDSVDIALNYKSTEKRSVRLSYELVASSTHDTTCLVRECSEGSHVYVGEGTEKVLSRLNLPEKLPGDALLLHCDMKAYGYEVDITRDVFEEDRADRDLLELRRNMKNMLETMGESTDVLFTFTGKNILAHRCVLRSRIPEFMRIHARELEMDTVSMVNHDYDTVKTFLNYVYTAEVGESWESQQARELYVLSSKYKLPGLRRICSKSIVFGLTVENVHDALQLADEYKDVEFRRYSESFAEGA